MREIGSQHPRLRVICRYIDEVAAYAYGAYGQVGGAAGVVERLTSLTQIMLSPWAAYGSANTVGEALPWIVFELALATLYVRYLMRLSSQHQASREAPPRPLVAEVLRHAAIATRHLPSFDPAEFVHTLSDTAAPAPGTLARHRARLT